jgi:predicted house-cleaning noncanonical NTP pyrophosphatase (MazG superfamily)
VRAHPDGYPVKLVRDRVADALGGDGSVTYRKLPEHEHARRLRQKLIEEAAEYALEPSVEELAQVVEVVFALARVDLGVNMLDVMAEVERQRSERGGFEEGVGMYAVHPCDRA